MVIWGIVFGALLGWLWPGYGDFYAWVGAFFGFLAGLTLRWAVRKEVAATYAKLGHKAAPAPQAASAASTARTARAQATVAVPIPSPESAFPALPEVAPTAQPTQATQPEVPVVLSPTPVPTRVPRPTPARQPRPPSSPDPITLAVGAFKGWLLGGNTIVRVGLVILFIGLSFLARYATMQGLIPIELRLAAIAAVGIALLAIGFKKREAKPGFALVLQGGGVAVMYLTVFAAFRLYGLLPPLLAFALMIVVCALSCALALLQNTRALAVAAFAGGFATPLLLSTGQGSHVGLFSYYMVLNLAILFIAHQRSWRVLNLVGFVATFGVATAWGVLKYAPQHYASTQPFLLGFVLIYLFTAILYARNTPTRLGNAVDSTLVFGTPLLGFGLQVGLVQHMELGSAFAALGFGGLYLLLAWVLARRALDSYRLLIECFMAIGIGFATLAVPLALDARWTSAVWALEGAGAFWVGMRQARWMPRAFGLLLQCAAMWAFVSVASHDIWALPLLNPILIGAVLIAAPAACVAWWLRNPLPHSGSRWALAYASLEKQLSSPLYLLGFAFWCLGWVLEVGRRLPATEAGAWPTPVFSQSTAQLLCLQALLWSAALSQRLGVAQRWAVATWPARASLAAMAFTWLWQVGSGYRVLDPPAWLLWPIALALHYWMLFQSDRLTTGPAAPEHKPARWLAHLHIGSVWLLTLLLADCLWYWIGRGDLWHTAWASVVLLVSATGVLAFLTRWAGRACQTHELPRFGWPLQPHARAYYWYAALPLALLLFMGTLVVALHSSGQTDPLPYIPLLNPTDIVLALALSALLLWRRVLRAATPAIPEWACSQQALGAIGLLAFVAINTVWLRVAHHFFGVDWSASDLFQSLVVQTGYAILWTLLAFSLMVSAHRRVQRGLWLVGAGLLGLVVLKLVLIDLSNVGGVERIIAFITVGVLMLVVGYFAPLPPKPQAAP